MEMDYRKELKNNLNKELEIAERVRAKGLDPEVDVEIKIARDLAERVEQLVGPEGVAKRIRALWSKDREELSLKIAMEIAQGKIGNFKNEEEAMFHAVRCGLAVLTEGVLVAPLEGLIKAKKGKNFDGSEYADIFFAGPIRSAGGTAQAMAVLIADVVRRERGLDRYKPVDEEIERCKEEIPLYKRLQHLQYLPSSEEIDLIVRNCPVFINGEGTEKEEISGLRGLSRFETDRVRGGACLVIAEGMCLKARKLQKHVKKLGIDGWEFIDEFIRVQEEKKEETGGEGEEEGDAKYLRDVVGGRPVISHPGRAGGFRLRYGRARTSGLAACALNPIVFTLLDDFLATGTQIKIETPGKAAVVTACDGLDRPSVLLDNGDFIEVKSIKEAKELRKRISEIIDLGEILIPYGEFLENNKPLLPQGYTREWWEKEYEEKTGKKFEGPVDFVSLLEISRNHSLPLHPDFNLFWNSESVKGVKELRDHILEHGKIEDERLFITKDEKIKEVLIELGVYHLEKDGGYEIIQHTMPLLFSLGLKIETERISEAKKEMEEISAFRYVSSMLGVEVKNKAPTMIGVRMGRPEKSKERLMKPAPHVLFPLRLTGGKQRLVQEAAKSNYPIEVEIATRKCSSCGRETHHYRCTCGERTDFNGVKKVKMDVKKELENALSSLKENDVVNIKGVEGLISRKKEAEPMEKGVLRAKHKVHVNKDGTLRYDMTDVPLTHFRPGEINVSIEKLKTLGYEKDHMGNDLVDKEQIVELRPQDIVISRDCLEFGLRAANFMDDLLVKFYGEKPYYNAKKAEDLIGSNVVGLAPHTSVGVLGRIIGYTDACVCFAHPFFHAAKRRNCDGDEDSIMLLLDALVNFSDHYLPSSRGGRMDSPLILSPIIDPTEIDKEAWNLDIMYSYPLEFYRSAESGKNPKEVINLMEIVEKRLDREISPIGFTFDTKRIDEGNKVSSYKTIATMAEKIKLQLDLAKQLRSVDEVDVAAKIINTHLLPDMMGNLAAFSRQEFRCTRCKTKYRRVPLSGKCTRCGKNLILTVHKGSVKKYLDISKEIIDNYEVPMYLKQCVMVAESSMDSLFENVKKVTLADFM